MDGWLDGSTSRVRIARCAVRVILAAVERSLAVSAARDDKPHRASPDCREAVEPARPRAGRERGSESLTGTRSSRLQHTSVSRSDFSKKRARIRG